MRKWGLTIAILLAIFFAAAYFGSPYLAANTFKKAALGADSDQLDSSVDFPSVRASLKSQLSALMISKMQNDPDMKDNPFAGLGLMIGPVVIDKAVDAYVTPEGISALVRGEKPKDGASRDMGPDIKASYDWLSIDRFRVKLRNTKANSEGPSLLFERRGLFSWKLIKVELPTDLLDKNNNVSATNVSQPDNTSADNSASAVASASTPTAEGDKTDADADPDPAGTQWRVDTDAKYGHTSAADGDAAKVVVGYGIKYRADPVLLLEKGMGDRAYAAFAKSCRTSTSDDDYGESRGYTDTIDRVAQDTAIGTILRSSARDGVPLNYRQAAQKLFEAVSADADLKKAEDMAKQSVDSRMKADGISNCFNK